MTDVRSDWLRGYKEAGLWLQRHPPAISGPSPTYNVTCFVEPGSMRAL